MSKQSYGELLYQALFNGNGIARRLIVALILFSSAITAIITTIQLYNNYQSDVNDIHDGFAFVQQSTLPVLSESVWVNDTAQIQSQINGLLNLRDMEYVAILINGKERWSAGQQASSRTVSKQIIMTRDYRGNHITIGRLRLVASLDNVWRRVWEHLFVVLIDNGIKTLLVALFMLLVFQILVTRHLVKLSHYARNLDPQRLDDEALQLDRPATGHWRPDALDYLAQAINDMRQKLHTTYLQIQADKQHLEKSEERLRLAMQATNEGVWDWSVAEGQVIFSAGWANMLGYDVDELSPTYETWESRIHPEDREGTRQKLQAHLENRSENFIAEHRLKTREGKWLWVLGRGAVIERDSDGLPVRAVGTMTDISTRKAAEEQLKQLNDELEARVEMRTRELAHARDDAERASRAKSSFLSRMSHELRTPMNAILGFAQLLSTDKKDPLSQDHLDSVREILNAGNHLLNLINEVLDLARIESGRLTLTSEAVEIEPLIQECLILLKPLSEQQGISLITNTEPGCVAEADRMRLSQVILNLLSNAIKYNTPGGDVHVTVRHTDNQRIYLAVTDTGIGISQEDIHYLFQPFERLQQTSNTTEGTGIGLALSKQLTEAMNGDIGVDSTPGKGSTFWLTIPASDKTVSTHLTNAETNFPESTKGEKSHHQLLYIEDNPANLRLMQRIFDSIKNVKLIDATTAEAGLQIATAQQPDMIFLDIGLPGMDGYVALQYLQNNPRTQHIPVIAVSANATAHDIDKGRNAGFVDYIVKPFDIATIQQALAHFLQQEQ